MTKILTFYLPQYHAIKENDEWWGPGFTDWVNVKKAKKLYLGHNQPRVPKDKDYYDLSDPAVMTAQMKLAQEYGVYGFCFYHYWFDGKKLLEKPVEALLDNKEAQMPYCLCWANEPWMRTWDGLTDSKQMLMPQRYGNEKEWKEHFDYLLPFFKDDRYIYVQNKPVFVIYRPTEIPNCYGMQQMWDDMAKENGFDGIYFIKMKTAFPEKKIFSRFDATVDFEPMRTMKGHTYEDYQTRYYKLRNKLQPSNKLDIIDYKNVCESMLKNRTEHNRKHYLGMFVGWDNTARKGKKGLIMEHSSPALFEKYLRVQMKRSEELENEFLFINAWNEWAEGTYLEPDEKYGHAYLEAVQRVVKKDKD